jgi:hypothetical protein
MKSREHRAPKIIRQITCGDFQANVAPPKSNPSSNMSVSPSTEALPNQSMALNPSIIFVLGLCTSKKKTRRTNVMPEIGRLIQKVHLQVTYCEKAPPSNGPTPPAKAHITSIKPRYRLRCLQIH